MHLRDAINVVHKRSDDGVEIYAGTMDPEFCIEAVPNGGYVLGQIVHACIQQQASSPHPDPINVVAHFLRSTSVSPFEIHVRYLRRGKSFTNLTADLLQNNVAKVTSHLIFGVLKDPAEEDKDYISLLPPSPFSRRIPLYHHPSKAPRTTFKPRYKFFSRFNVTQEPEIAGRNAVDSSYRTNSGTVGGGGLDYGIWCGFKDKDDSVTLSSLPFFADVSSNPATLLPKACRKNLGRSWFPTMMMTIEYKYPIPKPSKTNSNCTVGVYSSSHFLQDKDGRHDMYTEVWTAPCDIGEEVDVVDGWRDNQYCLAVSTQMALTVPIARNLSKGKL